MKENRPIASLSLDLDNQWSYMKTHGEGGWESFPSYLEVAVPRILDFLKERNLTITFFIVGQDAALDKNKEPLSAIAKAGHEIGNHSFNHEPWLHLYTEQQIDDDFTRAEEYIEKTTGKRPLGFRGPGFSISSSMLKVLARRGYLYDASTLPTYLNPLARAYFFMTSNLSREEKQKRKALFGSFRDGFRPIKPYRWRTGGNLLEIPVTTMPVFKVPIHFSYVLYLSLFSPLLALRYFRTAMSLCRMTGAQPSLLLHPLDFLGSDDTTELSFFPAMRILSKKKIEVVGEAIRLMTDQFTVLTLQRHAEEVARISDLPEVEPRFRFG